MGTAHGSLAPSDSGGWESPQDGDLLERRTEAYVATSYNELICSPPTVSL